MIHNADVILAPRARMPRASFRGDSTLNTDGIALTHRGFGNFPSGAFYAVHNDGNVAAFSWAAIADALGLRKDCDSPSGAAEPAS